VRGVRNGRAGVLRGARRRRLRGRFDVHQRHV
jgi:hypothetical protein